MGSQYWLYSRKPALILGAGRPGESKRWLNLEEEGNWGLWLSLSMQSGGDAQKGGVQQGEVLVGGMNNGEEEDRHLHSHLWAN